MAQREILLLLIGLARLFKAAVCASLVFGVVALRAGATSYRLAHLVDRAAHFAHLDDLDISAAGLVAAVYTCIFAAEAFGLLRGRDWGVRLTFWATAGFIPVEIYALVRHPGPTPLVMLGANCTIVGYLAWRARRRRGSLSGYPSRRNSSSFRP